MDDRPYLRESYYAETSERLHASMVTNQTARGEFSAGFGSSRLSPTLNAPQDVPARGRFRALPLAGYGDRHGNPATGFHDELFVKAVALRVGDRVGIMVGADALIIPPEVADLAARRLGQEFSLPVNSSI